MPDIPLPQAFDTCLREQARTLHANDEPPRTLQAWGQRRDGLRRDMLRAMGPTPETPCALEPRLLGTLRRPGYRIDKIVFQSRPNVWVTSSLYVPEPAGGRRAAVLVVHGHWAGARRDPVVQA